MPTLAPILALILALILAVILALILAALVYAGTAAVQTAGDDKPLFEILPTVFEILPTFDAVEPQAQTLAEPPANLGVITAAEVGKYGDRTPAEVAPVAGFYLACDHQDDYVGASGISLPGDSNIRFSKAGGVSSVLSAGTFRLADLGGSTFERDCAGALENRESRVSIAARRRALATVRAYHSGALDVSAMVPHANDLGPAENTGRDPGMRRVDRDVPQSAQLVSPAVRRERGTLNQADASKPGSMVPPDRRLIGAPISTSAPAGADRYEE